jgi:hypothetical protein
MAVYVVNLVIDQGSDFNQSFNLESSVTNAALNLTGYTGSAQVRKHASSSKFYDFTVSFTDRGNGTVKLSMTDTITSRIKPGRYIYDIILTDTSGLKERVVEGSVLVREGATKE